MTLNIGDWVIAHTTLGASPALVLRVNSNGTLSLCIFGPNELIWRHDVAEYEPESDDSVSDREGYWTKKENYDSVKLIGMGGD